MALKRIVPISISSPRYYAKGEVTVLDLTYALDADKEIEDTGMEPEDAVAYLRDVSGIGFPLYVKHTHRWDSEETGRFNANLIIELYKKNAINVERGGVTRTRIGDTVFKDRTKDGLTISFK